MARSLDLHGKAEAAWQRAFEPIKLEDDPEVWLQLKPQSTAFAGVHTTTKILEGSIEISGNAETFIDHAPPPVRATALAPLGIAVAAPGKFEVILPVRIGYDTLRQKIMDVIAAAPKGATTISDIKVYPSSGKLVVGLRVVKSADTGAGEWVYLASAPKVDNDSQSFRLPDLAVVSVAASDLGVVLHDKHLVEQLKQQVGVSYRAAYQKLLETANARLTRPLKNGFRMEGRLDSAKVDSVLLMTDGVNVVLRAGGSLKILYGF